MCATSSIKEQARCAGYATRAEGTFDANPPRLQHPREGGKFLIRVSSFRMSVLTGRLFSVRRRLARELLDQMNQSCFQKCSNDLLSPGH